MRAVLEASGEGAHPEVGQGRDATNRLEVHSVTRPCRELCQSCVMILLFARSPELATEAPGDLGRGVPPATTRIAGGGQVGGGDRRSGG